MKENFLILGGDKRQEFLLEIFKENNYYAELYFNNNSTNKDIVFKMMKKFKNIILPIPISKDNLNLNAPNFSEKISLIEILNNLPNDANLFYGGGLLPEKTPKISQKTDILKYEPLTIKNAMATAEAALSIIIKNTDSTIFGQKILILGYGRIAKFLAKYLKSLNAKVCIAARRDEVISEAELQGYDTLSFKSLKDTLSNFSVIVNTVPSTVLFKEELSKINNNALILDLASYPGGLDFESANKLNKKVICALSLPGKYSPKSAAEYIYSAIINNIYEGGAHYERC